MDERLDRENTVVLAAVQALIGAVTWTMSAISVELDHRRAAAVLHVALTAPADEVTLDLLEEVADDVNQGVEDAVAVTVRTWVGEDWTSDWPGREHRLVFAAHRL